MPVTDPYSQRNPLWATRPLGEGSGLTIGKAGCLLCSAAQMAYHLTGVRWTPWELNRALVAVRGYTNKGEMIFAKLAQATGLTFVRRDDYTDRLFTPADALVYERELGEAGGILVKVDSEPFIKDIQQHWVNLVEIDLHPTPGCGPFHGWVAYDPWYGEMVEAGQFYAPYRRYLDKPLWAVAVFTYGG
jgi:hypothetical protein